MLQADVGLQAETARVALERLNKEVKRRADVVAMIPNEGIDHPTDRRRAAGAKREWQLQHRYMQVEAIGGARRADERCRDQTDIRCGTMAFNVRSAITCAVSRTRSCSNLNSTCVEMSMNAFDTQRMHANLPDATGRQESVANMTSAFDRSSSA